MAPDNADWRRLATYVVRRRVELGLTQREIQQAGGPSVATLRNIEVGNQGSYQAVVLGRLERALGWKVGSVEAILTGGEPTPAGHDAGQSTPGVDWVRKLERMREIANNPDRSPGLRARAAEQARQIEDQIDQILAAARAEEEERRRPQAS